MFNPHQISNRIAIAVGAIVLAATLLPSAAARHVPDGSDLTERGPSGVIARPTAAFPPHVIGFDARYGSYAKVAGAGRFIDN